MALVGLEIWLFELAIDCDVDRMIAHTEKLESDELPHLATALSPSAEQKDRQGQSINVSSRAK